MLAAMYRSVLFHDDSRIFVFAYVGLAIVLALWLGLFWLAMVVLVHLVLEIVKQHHYDPRPLPVLARSLWELILDIGLVFFGLLIGLYMGVIIGAAGLGAAGRVGVQTATRVGVWQRGLRGFMITVDDLAMVVKARAVKKKAKQNAVAQPALAMAEVGAGASRDDDDDAITAVVPSSRDRASAGLASDADGVAVSVAVDGDAGFDEVAAAETTEIAAPHRPPVPPTGGPELWGGWVKPRWTRGERFAIGFTVVSLLLILATPLLTEHTVASTWETILHEMQPFPSGD